MRYTECRLAAAALAMVADIDEDVVDFTSNYDGREMEPTVLPAEIPALLVNGASGIAVGMATSIPSHNLGEVLAAAHHLTMHPDATAEELQRFIPGPDLPQGGTIVGLDGIREAYLTGRGTFKVRGTARIEQVSPRRRGIVITELPPGVGPERIIERVKDLVSQKKLEGIADIVDLTDGDSGLRLVIEVKNTINPEALLVDLYKKTPLEDSQSFNCVALVDGQPRTLGLAEAITVYVDHRLDVVRRRSEFRRTRARDRLHLVEGLLLAMVDIDEVIAVIRSSDDAAQARERLVAVFELSTEQAAYILDMPLRRLTKFSRIELEAERDELTERIAALTTLLEDDSALRAEVANTMRGIADAHATPRRTVLLESEGQATNGASISLDVPDEPCRVMLSSTGLIARTPSMDATAPAERANHDLIVSSLPTTTRATIAALTSRGRAVGIEVVDLPALAPALHLPALAGGVPIGALCDLDADEQIIGLASLGTTMMLATRFGTVKRVVIEPSSTRSTWEVISLRDGDAVVGCAPAHDGDELILVSSGANILRFPATAVRVQGQPAGGMAGMSLGDGDRLIFATAVADDTDVMVATLAGSTQQLPGTATGSYKVSALADVPPKGRATQGVRIQRLRSGEDALLLAWVGRGPALGSTSSGLPVDLPDELAKRDASGQPLSIPLAAIGGADG
jgi:DNA gyrase subunit A